MGKNNDFELLVDALKSLPNVGGRNAKRFAFFLIKQDMKYINEFVDRIITAKEKLSYCRNCGNLATDIFCDICNDNYRDRKKLLIVSSIEDLEKIEDSNFFKGLYHVTHGELSIRKGTAIEHTNLSNIKDRVLNGNFDEIIIATSYTHDGEMTAEYITNMLKDIEHIKIYRIGFGIPLNASINYADNETLKQSLINKREIKH
ncbi:recombination mediator RecR [Ureaplasma canigenitalium]|uniref:recombination mediator RecR n=1 Tax=Ureaplasma canigenitalium TaxID=42092 RepID=UPI0004E17ACD|nr:recombination mediator RecR [Ureaplasma canigenitalium]